MEYLFVKKAKEGELPEGENRMHTIRIAPDTLQTYLDAGWEVADESDESEWEGPTETEVTE